MTILSTPSSDHSPFHRGEQAIQQQLGVRDKMEQFGRRVIRDHLPEQHRDFYQQLPYLLLGHVDKDNWPWASILCNPPGFMESDNPRSLSIKATPLAGDPLSKTLENNARVGLLGIELATRRRNRLSGTISGADDQGFDIAIDQTFGNCPQYIQSRDYAFIKHDTPPHRREITSLDDETTELIRNSDTFFVSSFTGSRLRKNVSNPAEARDGVDVSHRGGKPGFVSVAEDGLLTIPDYSGNFHFNTLGNFFENPKAGLLFIDFEKGHLLMLTGTVEILWNSSDTESFEGAERFWTFKLHHGLWLTHSLPIRWSFQGHSPNTQLTGTWNEMEDRQRLLAQRKTWQSYTITHSEDETSTIRSFYLSPQNSPLTPFKAGQFLTIKAMINGQQHIRTYTVSSATHENFYRLSIKRDGVFSHFIHDTLSVNDTIEALAPNGDFYLDSESSQPVVFIAAGVGITPMVAMLYQAVADTLRSRYRRQVTLLIVARNQNEQAFYHELQRIVDNASDHISIHWFLTQADKPTPEQPFIQGRLTSDHLAALLPLQKSDIYLCGPEAFMQDTYDILQTLGIADDAIHAESFGPASIQRNTVSDNNVSNAADTAVVRLLDQQGAAILEQAWHQQDGTLLDFLESHDVQPPFSCRSGQCGACLSTRISGQITYDQRPSLATQPDDVLLCCAKPKKQDSTETPEIVIQLNNTSV